MLSISDLFGNYRLVTPKGKVLPERSSIVQFFLEQDFAFKDRKLTGKDIGIRLAHYSTDELYALKSAYKDRLQRNGKTTATKYWWAITKTK